MAPSPETASPLRTLTDTLSQNEESIRPLPEARYVAAHRAFEQASTQQAQIRRHIEAEVNQLVQAGRAPLDVLSVGCGCGLLDRPLLAHLSDSVASFTGIDPNASALAHCEHALDADPALPPRHVECTRVEDFAPDRRYDLVYCSHVFYYLDDRAAALRHMQSLLRDAGTLVIVHAPKAAMNTLAQVFWREHAQADFFAEDLRRLLHETAPPALASHSIDAGIPRALFSDDTPQGTLLLEFLIQAEWPPLSPTIKELVQAYLDRHAQPLSTRAVLPHPATTFTLRSDTQ
jgi:SAM-dependent methyltransferase